jgi:hypothetical protein
MDLGKEDWRVWIGFIWLRIRIGYGEHDNEPSDFLKGWAFSDEMSVLLASQD